MADLPITGLPPAVPVGATDILPIVQGGVTNQVELDPIRNFVVDQRTFTGIAPVNVGATFLGWLMKLSTPTADATITATAVALGERYNVIFKNTSAEPLTVTPQVGDKIEGVTGPYTLFPGDAVRLVCDGVDNFSIVSAVGSDVTTRTLTDVSSNYSIVTTDLDAILQMTGPGPLNAIAFKSTATASLVGRGWTVTIKANDFPLDIEPFGTDTIEGVPTGDGFCIPANSSVTLTSDGTSNFIVSVDGTQRLAKFVSHLAQAVSFTFAGLFSVAEVSTTVGGVKAGLQVVGGYENDRFIAGDTATVKNVGAFPFDLTTNSQVLIKTIGAGEEVILKCLTIPVGAGDGTWGATALVSDGTSNKETWLPASSLSTVGIDGADRRIFPAGSSTAIYFPTNLNTACRTSIIIPPDYPGDTTPLTITAYFSPEVASVGKNARLQLQRDVIRADNSESIGGGGAITISTEAVPAAANDLVTGTPYSFTDVGTQAGDILEIKFARIGGDVLDTYTEGGIQLTGLYFSY